MVRNNLVITISDGELVLLSMAIATLQKEAERHHGKILCSDGRRRSLSKEEAVDLLDRLGTLAGYERGFFKEHGKALAKELQS